MSPFGGESHASSKLSLRIGGEPELAVLVKGEC